MSVLLQFIGDWGHALAAVLFAALGIFLLRRRQEAADLVVRGLRPRCNRPIEDVPEDEDDPELLI